MPETFFRLPTPLPASPCSDRLYWHGITDAELLASGLVDREMLPGPRYRQSTGWKNYYESPCRLGRLKDGTLNAKITLEWALTRGGDPVLKDALDRLLAKEREKGRQEAKDEPLDHPEPAVAKWLLDVTSQLSFRKTMEVYEFARSLLNPDQPATPVKVERQTRGVVIQINRWRQQQH